MTTVESYYMDLLRPVVGGVIVGVAVDAGEGFVGLHVKKGRQTFIVWSLRDEEGNGPGHLDVQPVSNPEE